MKGLREIVQKIVFYSMNFKNIHNKRFGEKHESDSSCSVTSRIIVSRSEEQFIQHFAHIHLSNEKYKCFVHMQNVRKKKEKFKLTEKNTAMRNTRLSCFTDFSF